MKFIKILIFTIICLNFHSESALAEWVWTDNRWDGQEIEVTFVYPQWDQ